MATDHDSNTFLLFSDVHFDPFADPGLVSSLAAADVSQWKAIFASSDQTAPSGYGATTNYALLESALDSMAATAGDVDLVIFPGDILAHDFWQTYAASTGDTSQAGLASFIQKTVAFFVGEVDSRFPDAMVLVAIGNNDSLDGDYQTGPGDGYLWLTAATIGEAFFNDAADRTAFETGYSMGGYYAVEPDGPTGRKYIVLNNVLWSPDSDKTAAGLLELGWFASELADSAQDFQKVWVVGHIPVGGDAYAMASATDTAYQGLLVDSFNNAFVALEVAYAPTIEANFAGHIHRDEFRLISLEAFDTPSTLQSTAIAISPVYDNNPGYAVYAYDASTGALLDKTAYALDLSVDGAAWAEEYDFAEAYGQGLATPTQWLTVMENILSQPASRAAYTEYYTAGAAKDGSAAMTAATFPVYWLADAAVTSASFNAVATLLAQA